MTDFGSFEAQAQALAQPLSQTEKAAAVLLAMGKSIAGKLLKFFTQSELQAIIAAAQSLRAVPPHELEALVNEFEDLFTEGAGLMDNAKAMESILEEGLTPDEVDGLLGRRATFQSYEASIWDRLMDCDPVIIAQLLAREHPQTIAYVLSMMPSSFGAKVLLQLSDKQRPEILNRAVNIKNVNPKAAAIIEARVIEIIEEMETERNSPGPAKIAEVMNELEKPQVDTLLASLETISTDSAKKVRPKIFLFDDILFMPQRSRVQLFNDVSTDVITMALRGSAAELRESILASIGARQRRMIESDLAAGDAGINPRDIAIARRSITQEAIRLSASGQLELKEKEPEAA
ncbi:flagellar motor switch protein FliG [Sinorhizobium meliloti WSM1022]|jgi:flagellar motor switch protein FliG|uniref:flagellar motor switch protein FliG n=1 Tax=Rhizobium meliloti TaxID=382 RepID=UPI0002A58241|nr:flagellar motor switch protein FliG [Sinorhizobium meliloti]AGA05610.1 Flagellar motor switch protein [Sinorhizobium meliloti GR4]ASQ05036.1 flagellar motor switch protein FliG [Sinorhizobium meliloti]MCO6421908.1 flagellar motor switch protein FliG [Sinorhizobium meliloti]MDE3796506.1 flagellar motor switch protein FliG [Sinorhizobium meliloti]MDE4600344.1 flagellar motor switch protein FliG [Sinorhizobium meliloti]